MAAKVLCILVDGVEEIELVTPVDGLALAALLEGKEAVKEVAEAIMA